MCSLSCRRTASVSNPRHLPDWTVPVTAAVETHLSGGKLRQSQEGDLIVGGDLVVVGSVGEGEGQHTLLLEVCLVDTGKGAYDDGTTTEVAGLQCGVLPRATLAWWDKTCYYMLLQCMRSCEIDKK